MACRECTAGHPVLLDSYPAGDTRASLVAAHRATQARNEAPGPVHVHYDQANDTFAVIRTDPQEIPA
ncbi:hypothetical protein DEJ48_10805 [Streptomyces venezuelae]|uniref:Uncharacterized protein n=1 Tax=Streptomyces venezuelae TaxID=54571 RepID=A0A5P2BTK7_STRVZ|nr:hypothetical protein [Streptomyces venezuelae]QES33812.1 hypothetical protein DEJ48_10805 [Streptomyces venezuelae]